MSDTPSKLFAVLALLLGVWVLTYWLYQPSSASAVPRVTLDPRISEPPPSPVPDASTPPIDRGNTSGGSADQPVLREPKLPLPELPKAGDPTPPKPPVKTRRVQKVIEPQWRTYIVQKGDTGWKAVAARKEVFGDASKWQIISRSNPLASPDRLKPGVTELRIPLDPENIQGKLVWVDEPIPDEPSAGPGPATPPTEPSPPPGEKTYTITREDTLWEISKKFYGKGASWRVIYDANRALIPDPDRPPAGVTIRIPAVP
ncbi:MAG: LysM peptidoglycan-binding domain-containing protein [Phycisphaerales bacterium]|nr:LysM peptidoglycan-binding domain-containing protein [Phycisphaerales bacterium]